MSQLLIISDSHYDNDTLQKIFERYSTLPKIHLGDSSLSKEDSLLKDVLVVKGNHDDEEFPEFIIHPPYFICHGHTFNVYHGFEKMIKIAKKHQCHTILHGHTHICYDAIHDGIRIINPGSSMINRGSYGFGTYTILNTETQDITFYHHETHEDVTHLVLEDGKKTFEEFRNLIKEFRL